MAQDVYLQGATYPDVPAVEVPVIAELINGTVNISMSIGGAYSFYGIIQGVADYIHDSVTATFDGTEYTLPYDPDPNGYAEGYRGYGATYSSSTTMDFSVYPFRVEDDDSAGGWRVYYSSTGNHTIVVQAISTGKFTDVSDTTATASLVASGQTFYLADGTKATGTATGGILEGVIRNDAELVKRYTYDQYLVADEGITLPSYSTTSATLKASASLEVITVDYANYDYFAIERALTIPEYSVTTKAKGREDYAFYSSAQEVIEIPGSTIQSIDGTKEYTSRLYTVMNSYFYREVYWSSSTAITTYATTAYGVQQVVQNITASSSSLTVRSPSVTIRGHTTYFTQTYYDALTDVRLQYIIEVYRVKKGSSNLDGWGLRQLTMNTLDDVANNSGNLT